MAEKKDTEKRQSSRDQTDNDNQHSDILVVCQLSVGLVSSGHWEKTLKQLKSERRNNYSRTHQLVKRTFLFSCDNKGNAHGCWFDDSFDNIKAIVQVKQVGC